MPDEDKRKSVVSDLNDLKARNLMDEFDKVLDLATTDYTVSSVSKATENAVDQPDVDVRRDLAGTRQRLSVATRTIGDTKRSLSSLEVVNASMMKNALNNNDRIGFLTDLGIATYVGARTGAISETQKIGKKDRSGLLLKILPWIAVLLIGIVAIVELSNPKLLLPFTSWLQPSNDCQSSVISNNPGGNATYIQTLTDQCMTGIFYVGLEHILAVVLIVGIPLAILAVVLLKRRKKLSRIDS